MRKKTLTKIAQKIVVIICIVMLLATTMPRAVFADDDGGWSFGGALLKEFMQLLSFLGDMAMGLLNNVMLGADGVGSAMLSYDNENLKNSESWLYLDQSTVKEWDAEFMEGEIDTKSFIDLGGDDFEVPNMLYSPENIFANNIAALDINFLNPNTYQAVSSSEDATEKAGSSASTLQPIIASWYAAFRNIAVVGLLTVLIYLGIRILLSSTASDKAQYKERLKDWFVALCLVFFIHFIMSGLLMFTDRANSLFSTKINQGYTVKAYDDSNKVTVAFRTNLMGLMRFQAQSYDAQAATAYTIIYIALVIYTFIFTFMYFKRFLYVAFFTMIAPLVALTYPIDRAGDGKSQAFNMWFKEYTLNVIIQPIHLILYTVFVGSANDLARDNPIYALVAIAFLIPAEKFIKKMFGLDQASSTGDFGSFAGGAMAMQGLNSLGKALGGGAGKGNNQMIEGGKEGENKEGNSRIKNVNAKPLDAFKGNEENEENKNKVHTALTDEQKDELNSLGLKPGDPEYNQYLRQHGLNPTNDKGETQVTNGNKNPKMQDGARSKLAIAGAKSLGKGVYKGAKLATRLGVAAAGAAAGAAKGLTTGDPSKVFQYTMAGAGTGYMVGKSVANLPEKAVKAAPEIKNKAFDKLQDAKYAYNKAVFGEGFAEEQRTEDNNAREKRKFLNNKNERERLSKMAQDITGHKIENDEDLDSFMSAHFDYQTRGITDENYIKDSLAFEHNNGGIGGKEHKLQTSAAQFSQKKGLTKEDFTDSKKLETLENEARDMKPNMSEEDFGKMMQNIGGSLGVDYKRLKKMQNK